MKRDWREYPAGYLEAWKKHFGGTETVLVFS